MFGVGKIKPYKILEASQLLRHEVLIFGDINADREDIATVGENYIKSLYTGNQKAKSLDELRYLYAISSRYSTCAERMPPTSHATKFHCWRAHYQCIMWRHLQCSLPPHEYGFKDINGAWEPVVTDLPAAPQELVQRIKCSCKRSKALCSSCTCKSNGIQCSIHCACESVCLNSDNHISIGDVDID